VQAAYHIYFDHCWFEEIKFSYTVSGLCKVARSGSRISFKFKHPFVMYIPDTVYTRVVRCRQETKPGKAHIMSRNTDKPKYILARSPDGITHKLRSVKWATFSCSARPCFPKEISKWFLSKFNKELCWPMKVRQAIV
jgi:hypothetical protein